MASSLIVVRYFYLFDEKSLVRTIKCARFICLISPLDLVSKVLIFSALYLCVNFSEYVLVRITLIT